MEINAYVNYCKSRGVDKVTIESTFNDNLFVTLEKRAAVVGANQWFKAKFVVNRTDIYSYEDILKGEKDFFDTTNEKINEVSEACVKWIMAQAAELQEKNDGQE